MFGTHFGANSTQSLTHSTPFRPHDSSFSPWSFENVFLEWFVDHIYGVICSWSTFAKLLRMISPGAFSKRRLRSTWNLETFERWDKCSSAKNRYEDAPFGLLGYWTLISQKGFQKDRGSSVLPWFYSLQGWLILLLIVRQPVYFLGLESDFQLFPNVITSFNLNEVWWNLLALKKYFGHDTAKKKLRVVEEWSRLSSNFFLTKFPVNVE